MTPQALEHPASFAGRDAGVDRLGLSTADSTEVHRFVARRVANRADAADIAQQTLLLACEKSGTFRGENLSGWLLTIARNLIVDHYRTQNRFQFLKVEALAETEPALRTLPEAVQVAFECRARVTGWLDCITHRLRLEEQVAVLLADIYGYGDKDSAVVLGMSLPSFKLLLHGARARLHEVAGGKCTVVRKTNGAAACDGFGNGHGSKNAERGNGGPPSVYATHRVSVTCRLGGSKLLRLRGRLVRGLQLTSAHRFPSLCVYS